MTDLNDLEGLFVGQLDKEELELFEREIESGNAIRSYEGSSGFFVGLAKVRSTKPHNRIN